MNHSEQFGEIAAALAAAQGKMDHASKDRTNPAFKAKYADLASVLDACRPHLSAHEIAILQPPALVAQDETRAGGMVRVETWLIHKSGQWFSATLEAAVPDIKAQTIGSAITYLRRYGLSAMAGIAPDDDDGNAASRYQRAAEDPPPQAPPMTARPPLTLAEAEAKVLKRFPLLQLDVDQIKQGEGSDDDKVRALSKLYANEKTKTRATPEGASA